MADTTQDLAQEARDQAEPTQGEPEASGEGDTRIVPPGYAAPGYHWNGRVGSAAIFTPSRPEPAAARTNGGSDV